VKVKLATEPAIKTPAQFTFLPRRIPRVDLGHKTNGSAEFGLDAQVRGMVFVSINACPVRGGKLKSVDESVLSGVPGIVDVVQLEDAVAVVATDTFWRAKPALSRLRPEWDVGAAGHVDSEQLSKEFRAALTDRMVVARNDGNVDKAMSGAPQTLEAIYETPYLSHSPLEPLNATVNLQPDRLDVCVGTQDAEAALGAAASASGPGCPGCHLDRSKTPEPCKGDGILDSDLRYLCKLADYHARRDFRYRSRFPDLGSRT
jgi:isoquinoline 1-oxidoreductase beta subunit